MVKADAEEIKARAQTLNFIFVVFFITRKCNEGRRRKWIARRLYAVRLGQGTLCWSVDR